MRPAQTLALILVLSVLLTDDAVARKRHVSDPMPTYVLQSATTSDLKPSVCTDAKTREKIRTIMFQALELALNDHVMNLFENWMKDSTGQPGRAKVGIDKGIAAYIHAARAIALWDVLMCEKD